MKLCCLGNMPMQSQKWELGKVIMRGKLSLQLLEQAKLVNIHFTKLLSCRLPAQQPSRNIFSNEGRNLGELLVAQVLPVIDERREGTCSSHIFDGFPTPIPVHTLASKFLLWATSPGMGFSLRARESCVPGMSSVPCRFFRALLSVIIVIKLYFCYCQLTARASF